MLKTYLNFGFELNLSLLLQVFPNELFIKIKI